jgi:hypothetical protein
VCESYHRCPCPVVSYWSEFVIMSTHYWTCWVTCLKWFNLLWEYICGLFLRECHRNYSKDIEIILERVKNNSEIFYWASGLYFKVSKGCQKRPMGCNIATTHEWSHGSLRPIGAGRGRAPSPLGLCPFLPREAKGVARVDGRGSQRGRRRPRAAPPRI